VTRSSLRVVIVNGLAAIWFMIGYTLFGVAMIRTATLPRWARVLVAVGALAHLLGFRDRRGCHYRRMADRDLWQSESRRWPWLAELSALAHIDVTGRNGAPAHRPNASGPLPLCVD
jgi:hypothetical protein